MRREISLPLTSLAITISAVIVIVAVIIVPSIRTIKTMAETIARQERELAERAALGETIRTARETLQEVHAMLPQLEATLIRPDQQVEFVLTLERLARRHGITHKLTLAQNGGDTLPFHLTLKGNFRAIGRVLTDLARFPWYLAIESLNLESRGGEAAVVAELSLTGFLNQP